MTLVSLLMLVSLRSAAAAAGKGPRFAEVSAIEDVRCAPACLSGIIPPDTAVVALDGEGDRTCLAKTGRPFHWETEEGEGDEADLTPFAAVGPCPLRLREGRLVLVDKKARGYKAGKLVRMSDSKRIAKADQAVRDSGALEKVATSLYPVADLTEQPPEVSRYAGARPELLLLHYGMKRHDGAGPWLALWKGKAWPITGICGGKASAFHLRRQDFLRVRSMSCCECDDVGRDRFYLLEDGAFSLVQELPGP